MKGKKSNTRQILLSVAALFVILIVAAGITFSWVEGGDSFTILTDPSKQVKIGGGSGTTFNGVVLNPDTNTSIDLAKVDKNSADSFQDLYFAEVSGNGENLFLPTAYDASGNPKSYRAADTNDVGKKFIQFKFNTQAKDDCYLSFDVVPTFTVKDKNGNVLDDKDTSAFRIMIKCGTEKKIFYNGDSDKTESVVTGVNGTKGNVSVVPFSSWTYDATNHSRRMFEYTKDQTKEMTVAVWLDGASANSDLLGCSVTVDLKLKVARQMFTVTYDAVTFDNAGNKLANGFAGGSIKDSTETGNVHTEKYDEDIAKNGTASATASANTQYDFDGWYTNSDLSAASKVENVTDGKFSQAVTANITYFAKFVEKPEYEVKVAVGAGSGTVYIDTTGTTSKTVHRDGTVTLNAVETGNNYKFKGWYKDNPNCTGTAAYTAANQTITVSASTKGTYYAKFEPAKTTTLYFESRSGFSSYYPYVYNSANETILYNGKFDNMTSAAAYDSATGYYKFTFTTGDTGNFKVIICSSKSGANQYPGQGESGLEGTIGGTYFFPAGSPTELKSVSANNMYTVTLKVATNNSASNTSGGKAGFSSSDLGTSKQKKIFAGTSVELHQSATSGYQFEGFYDAVSGGTNITSPYTPTSSKTIYARFKQVITYKTYYFQNTDNWSKVCAYAWNDGSGTKYLGEFNSNYEMTYVSGTARTYSIQVNSNADRIIFHNGSSTKTGDLTLTNNAGKVYVYNSGWQTYTGPYRTIYVYTGDCASWYTNDSAVPALKCPGKVTSYITYTSVSNKYYEFTTCPYDAYDIVHYRRYIINGNVGYANNVNLGTPPSDKNAIAINSGVNGTGDWYNH